MGVVYPWMRESLLSHLNCLVPVYHLDGGNYTEIWFDDGRKELERNRTVTVLRRLARFLGINPRQNDTPWGRGGNRRATPIILFPELILVPLLLRRPRYRDQGGTGYVVLQKIIDWEAAEMDGYHSVIFLEGNQKLYSVQGYESLSQRLIEARKAGWKLQKLEKALNQGLLVSRQIMTIQVDKTTGEITFR
ncbi:hypothetical protein [Neomoorella thermoacetica]|uniref:hypothetical protein n=1 Tax=Neomoorella thermoacetica TaxID=1525 RepID=UPI00046FEBBC|nr:hypothetical protein [Moorella thermoacetica]